MKKKYIVIIMILSVIIVVLLGLLFWNKKVVSDSGTVRYVGDGYVIVEAQDKKEYSLKTNQDYEIGDQLSFSLSKVRSWKEPIEGEVFDVKQEKQDVSFVIQDAVVADDVVNVPVPESGSSMGNVENTSPDVAGGEENSVDAVMVFAEQLEEEVDRSGTLTESIKSGFVTLVDFLFYDGTIAGKRFAELTDTAKLKILKVGLSIDQKIEKKFPHYKEEVKETSGRVFTNVKAKVVEIYLDIATRVCSNREDVCSSAKEGFGEMKKNFSLTWNFIKEISGVGVSKLKSWYEIWRES